MHVALRVRADGQRPPPHFRMLGLSATPGKDLQRCRWLPHSISQMVFENGGSPLFVWSLFRVQAVVSNLCISRIEVRGEDDIDIRKVGAFLQRACLLSLSLSVCFVGAYVYLFLLSELGKGSLTTTFPLTPASAP